MHYLLFQIVASLGSETLRPSSAAQCVACVACAELPLNLWPDLIQCLLRNVTNPSSTEMMKESTLEAIGYICQDIVRMVCGAIHSNFAVAGFLTSVSTCLNTAGQFWLQSLNLVWISVWMRTILTHAKDL